MEGTKQPDGERWSIGCPYGPEEFDLIRAGGQPSEIWIDGHVNRAAARLIRRYSQTPRLWLRSASPAAINELIRMPSLKYLDVMWLTGRGTLRGSSGLKSFRISPSKLSNVDMAVVLSWKSLESLRLRCVDLKPTWISGLCSLSGLCTLDLEDGNLNDAMARRLVVACPHLRELQLANTRISRRGLQSLVEGLPKLESLDIWGTRVRCSDIPILENAASLRYLSCGGPRSLEWPGHELMQHLRMLKSLREVWLDGVVLSDAEQSDLRRFVPMVQITCRDDD